MPDRGRTRVARMGASHTICVFTVPILDSAGNVLEEHAVAIRIPPGPLATADHRQVEAARTLACRATMPRLARVRRWQRSQQQRGSVRDSAIAAALTETLRPDETQPGLFDRRAVNVFEISQRNAAEFSADEAARSASRESFASAEIGRPHLAVMLT